jgi:hypothetical protein
MSRDSGTWRRGIHPTNRSDREVDQEIGRQLLACGSHPPSNYSLVKIGAKHDRRPG